MKIKVLYKKLCSTLSCISKCLKICSMMIHKKIIFVFLTLILLGACTTPTAMLGPAYTLTSSGSIAQASFSYGSSELVKNYTGKTPLENLVEISENEINRKKENSIKRKTLKSKDFYNLVKKRIEITGAVLEKSNQ